MLFYAFTPYHNQDNFPVFDTSSVTSSLAQLLSETSFFGDDRVADKNFLTAALTTRFLDDEGFERIRASVAQRYYFDRQRVVLPGQPVREDDESDLFFETGIKASEDLSISALGQYTRKLGFGRIKLSAFAFHLSQVEHFRLITDSLGIQLTRRTCHFKLQYLIIGTQLEGITTLSKVGVRPLETSLLD